MSRTGHEAKAQVLCLHPRLAHMAMLTLLTLAIVTSFRAVGTLLVFGLLIAPPATAALLARSVPAMMFTAAVLGAGAVVLGLLLSWHLGTAAGATVAQGLAQAAGLLLLDEPITGLDLLSTERIGAAIRNEREHGVTVVLSTHDMADAAAADWVLLLAGRVIAAGPPAEVLVPSRLTEAYGVSFVTEGGRTLIDDPAHRPTVGRHTDAHARTGPDLDALPE